MKGKYDDIVEAVCQQTQAELVSLMIVNGERGSGLSVAGVLGTNDSADRRAQVAKALRMTADMIEGQGAASN